MVLKKLKKLFSKKKKETEKIVKKIKPKTKKIQKKIIPKKISWTSKKYDNRFQKFYDLNKKRINEERRKRYKDNIKKGLCVRCSKKALKGIKLCSYHRKKQQEYNKKR